MDAEGHETTYIYDDLGRIVEELSPDRGRITYCYDSANNLISRTDARGITARYDYDVLNRLTAIHYPDNSEDILFTYDRGINGKGKRTAITDESGTTTFTYDSRGRLTGKVSTVLGKSFRFSRVLSPSARVMGVKYLSGRVMRYTRDSLGRMQALTMIKDTISIPMVTDMTHNPFGEARVHSNSVVENNFRLPGQYFDEETGFHYNYHRYYDPKAGRYITPDPIGLRGGINLFFYANSNSINFADSKGTVALAAFAPVLYIAGAKVLSMAIVYSGVKLTHWIASRMEKCESDVEEERRQIDKAFILIGTVNAAKIGAAGTINLGLALAQLQLLLSSQILQ